MGTIAAVVTALALAGAESRRRKRDAHGRSMWIALSLRPGLTAWLTRIAALREALESGDYAAALDVIQDQPDRFLKPPNTIIEMRLQVPELGEIAEPLAQGTFLLTEVLADWKAVDSAFHGSTLQPQASKAISSALSKLRAAEILLQKAEADICDRLRRPTLVKVRAYVAMRRGRRNSKT
jgi:hypothetical protein